MKQNLKQVILKMKNNMKYIKITLYIILKSFHFSTTIKNIKLIKRCLMIQIWVIGQQCICLSVKFHFHNNMIALCLWNCLYLKQKQVFCSLYFYMKLNIFVQTYMNKRNEVVQMRSAAIQVISYLNEIINLNQLRSNSYSRRKIRRLAICESSIHFVYLKFPPNLFFKSTFHLRTVYNKNVSFLIL